VWLPGRSGGGGGGGGGGRRVCLSRVAARGQLARDQ